MNLVDVAPPLRRMQAFRALMADALDNVRVKPTKSILALLGIAVGTASVIALLHIGSAAKAEAMRQFDDVGADFITFMAPPGGPDRATFHVEDIASLPSARIGLAGAVPLFRGSNLVFEKGVQIPVDIVGTPPAFASLLKLVVDQGRFVSPLDGFQPFAVIGAAVASRLSSLRGRAVAIDDRFHIGTETYRVIGVLAHHASNPVIGIDPDKTVIINTDSVRRLLDPPVADTIVARLAPSRPVEETVAAVVDYFRPRLKGANVNTVLARDLIESIAGQTKIYDDLLLAVGGISMTLGGVGIMNVMLMAVMERRSEVGLRMAIGASPRSIRTMFLAEAIILAAGGAVVGLGFGVLAGWLFARLSGWSFVFAPSSLPMGIATSIGVGAFFGLYPAHRAASLLPVEALRGS